MTVERLSHTHLIGLGHRARSGKDFAAQAIHEAYPRETRIYHWADALKAYCRVARGMTAKDGPLLQRVGTDELRAADPDIWIRALYWQIAEEQPDVALIPDTRFPNEAEFIRSQGGHLIHVQRLNPDGTPYRADDRNPNHASECALDGYSGWDSQIIAVSGQTDILATEAVCVFAYLKAAGRRGGELC